MQGCESTTYSRAENGHIPDLEPFAKLCKWLQRDPKEFLGMESEGTDTERSAAVVHFKKKKTVSMETAKTLGELILAAEKAIRAREELLGRQIRLRRGFKALAERSSSVTSPPANLPQSRSCVREVWRKCLRMLVEREGLEPSTPAL
jgi:transcriptional regulator with XRE-family HTH domain